MNHEELIEIFDASSETLAALIIYMQEHEEITEGININTAVGEIGNQQIEYQIQISLISDKRMWMGESEIRHSECTKVVNDC